MATGAAIWVLFISLIIMVGVSLYLYGKVKTAGRLLESANSSNMEREKYRRAFFNLTKLVNGCVRCRKVLDEKIKRRNAKKIRL